MDRLAGHPTQSAEHDLQHQRAAHRKTDSQGLTWSLSYTSGLLTTVTDPMGRQTTLTYSNGYLTKVTIPGNSGNVYASFTYDASNRLHTCTDAAGYTYTYGYDSSNRSPAW